MVCKKCQTEMSEGEGAVMAKLPEDWVISKVEVFNCGKCDHTEVRVVEK